MFSSETLYNLVLLLPGLLLSLTVHEYAHARTALAFGDDTARLLGRCTLNPLRHLDPLGTIAIIITTLSGMGFGWAKPVPINPYNLHPRRLGDIAVSLAGPLSNFTLAVIFGAALKLLLVFGADGHLPERLFSGGVRWLIVLMMVNVALGVFNLIPLFPLDGHHILREILPGDLQEPFMRWQVKYGMTAILILVIGPRLATMVLGGRTTIDPLRVVFHHVQDLVMKIGNF